MIERERQAEATQASLLKLAISAVLSKKAGAELKKQVEKRNVETRAYEPEGEEAPVENLGEKLMREWGEDGY